MNEGDNLPETDSTTHKVPASAWRPFERGPRSCIGQEFANIEARIIIAYCARRYDFTKVGLGEAVLDVDGHVVRDSKGDLKFKSPLYNVSPSRFVLVLIEGLPISTNMKQSRPGR